MGQNEVHHPLYSFNDKAIIGPLRSCFQFLIISGMPTVAFVLQLKFHYYIFKINYSHQHNPFFFDDIFILEIHQAMK